MSGQQQSESRREFVKKASYIAPTILTLVAAPAFAKSASTKDPSGSGGYVYPVFTNGQAKTIYDWLISDPARAARLADAVKALKALKNSDAVAQLTLQLEKECASGLGAKQGLALEVLKQALANVNLGEMAKALLAAG